MFKPDVACVCGHAKLHHYVHLVGEVGVCKADDCRCLQYVPQSLRGYAVSGDSLATLDERDVYKRGFEAALKWLGSECRKDVLADDPKDSTWSDEYKMDLDDMRGARRRLEKAK